jgi:DNA uptake protein ComE-like DNA-binding protein
LGGWKNADPNEIIRQRAALRAEQAQLDDVRRQAASLDAPTGLVDLNTASNRQLQNVPGIGVQLAARIVAGRPYRSVDDLLRVSGIGPKLLAKLRPHVIVTGAVSNASAP